MKVMDIVKATGGRLISGDPNTVIEASSISTDTRTIKKSEFFIALHGRNFDGKKFVEKAFDKGAIGAIVTHHAPRITHHAKRTLIFVKDSTKALGDIAHFHRMKFDIPIICVTGSNGKTTVKDMIASILSVKYKVLKNEGTKNNYIGVPQTLLKLNKRHDICVLELGTNHRGEINRLSDIARPAVAVITNIGPSHLEFLRDLGGVCKEKLEVTNFLGKKGVLIVNGDDPLLSGIKRRSLKILKYGFDKLNDFRARDISGEGCSLSFRLGNDRFEAGLLGIHNVYNMLAAIAVASQLKVSRKLIKEAVAALKPTAMRMDSRRIGGYTVINDAYNSNPLSMKCALETIRHLPAGARWVVSGDMLELGKASIDFHRRIGKAIAGCRIEGLLTLGKLSKYTLSKASDCGMNKDRLWHCESHKEIADILNKMAAPGDVVLVKGSRAMRMEKVIELLMRRKEIA